MTTVKFFLRPSTRPGFYPGSLSLRVIHKRKPRTVALSCYIYPDEWDAANQKVVYSVRNSERTTQLQAVENAMCVYDSKIKCIVCELKQRGYYSVDDIIDRLRIGPMDGRLLSYAHVLATNLYRKNQPRLAGSYMTVSRGLVNFNKGKDIPLSHINAEMIRDFEFHLREIGRQPNTISFYMRNLRSIYNKAVEDGCVAGGARPFSGVFTGVEDTRKRAMSVSEVQQLSSADLSLLLGGNKLGVRRSKLLHDLTRARQYFFFCFYAQGMCFVDMCYLKKTNIYGDVIRYYRRKTGKRIEVPINDGMKFIISSFEGEMVGSDYLFPIIKDSNSDPRHFYETALRVQNRRLARISVLIGFQKKITTHVARHSWASILKNSLQPLSVISEGLGHTSEKMTRKYLDSFDNSILSDAGRTLLNMISNSANESGLNDGLVR